MNDLFKEIIQALDSDNFYEYTRKYLRVLPNHEKVVRHNDKIICGISISLGTVEFVFKDFLVYRIEAYSDLRKTTWKYYKYGVWGFDNSLSESGLNELSNEQKLFYFKYLNIFEPSICRKHETST